MCFVSRLSVSKLDPTITTNGEKCSVCPSGWHSLAPLQFLQFKNCPQTEFLPVAGPLRNEVPSVRASSGIGRVGFEGFEAGHMLGKRCSADIGAAQQERGA